MLTQTPAPGASRPDAQSRTPIRRPLAVLLVAAVLAATQLACFGGARSPRSAPGPAPTRDPDSGDAVEVNVEARLFGFEMSADSASAGPVTFVVENDDFLPHDFRITGNGIEAQTERLGPGETATLTVDLAPGTYTYICTVEGHSENMRGTFTVED